MLKEKPAEYWLELLERHDVPCAPALRRFELIEHPQVAASESLVETDHPVAGRLRLARTAARFSESPAGPPRGAPRL
ncbi:CoA transferase, partial [Streptomyces sp. P17]|uniref:CoA transferase n=1 Tax=Streptomyces sp. P17 TaxID=3074716 RepID=UPI0028F3E771